MYVACLWTFVEATVSAPTELWYVLLSEHHHRFSSFYFALDNTNNATAIATRTESDNKAHIKHL